MPPFRSYLESCSATSETVCRTWTQQLSPSPEHLHFLYSLHCFWHHLAWRIIHHFTTGAVGPLSIIINHDYETKTNQRASVRFLDIGSFPNLFFILIFRLFSLIFLLLLLLLCEHSAFDTYLYSCYTCSPGERSIWGVVVLSWRHWFIFWWEESSGGWAGRRGGNGDGVMWLSYCWRISMAVAWI